MINEGRAIECAILFVDLVDSSGLAGSVGLEHYANAIMAFERLCLSQCAHFFETIHQGIYQADRDYAFQFHGDELVVFLHSGHVEDDVYQLIILAIAIKCGWLGLSENAARIAERLPAIELAAGIHAGQIWIERRAGALHHYGFAINVAKRVESASRDGSHYRILLSDAAFKHIVRRMRNLVVGPRRILQLKGIASSIGAHEIVDSFADPSSRLLETYLQGFRDISQAAMQTDTFDLWVHSCLQLVEDKHSGSIDDHRLELCNHILTIDPNNPVALYCAAQAYCDRKQYEQASLYCEDLTTHWPTLADGWLSYGEVLGHLNRPEEAAKALHQAARYGVSSQEIERVLEPE